MAETAVCKSIKGALVKQWLWADQLRIAAELDGAAHLVSRFVYGDKPTTPELVIRGSTVYRVISDHLGSVRALVNINDASDVPVRLDYEAFGSVSGTGADVIPQGFAGGLSEIRKWRRAEPVPIRQRVLETPWRRNRDRGPDFQKCV